MFTSEIESEKAYWAYWNGVSEPILAMAPNDERVDARVRFLDVDFDVGDHSLMLVGCVTRSLCRSCTVHSCLHSGAKLGPTKLASCVVPSVELLKSACFKYIGDGKRMCHVAIWKELSSYSPLICTLSSS